MESAARASLVSAVKLQKRQRPPAKCGFTINNQESSCGSSVIGIMVDHLVDHPLTERVCGGSSTVGLPLVFWLTSGGVEKAMP